MCSRGFYNPHGYKPINPFQVLSKKTILLVDNVIEKDRNPKAEDRQRRRPL
jgi:hypothetical protein